MPEPTAAPAASVDTQPLDTIFDRPASDEDTGGEASPATATTDQQEEVEPGAADNGEGAAEADESELAALVEKFAKEYGIKDLQDPEALKSIDLGRLMKRLADKERYILKLRGEQATKPPEVQWDEGLATPGTKGPETEPEKGQDAPAGTATPPDQDIGSGWKAQKDAIVALNEAYAEGDYDKVSNIENAMWRRQFTGMAAPIIQNMHQELRSAIEEIRSQMSEFIPDLRGASMQRQFEQDKGFIIDKLKSIPENADLMENLFEEQDGPPIEFNGKEYENTPYNRILIDNPFLLKIREEDKDSRIAQRKTLYTRMEAALRIYRKEREGSLEPGKAQELVEAGKLIAARNGKDRVRQSLNAGTSSAQGAKKEKDYAQTLQEMPGHGAVDEIFR